MKRSVEREGEGGDEGFEGGALEGGAFEDEGPELSDGVAASARSTAASSSGRLCGAPPPSEFASCQAPKPPAAVPTATHAAVTAALRHVLTRTSPIAPYPSRPLSPIVS
ncbi:hypothetical protein [Streptomyces sp. NPDC059009]|uniref:hypothetical protein n=1 Tax=Streptomyces sp. NPDC059009 TaxID=3346694 RepID=UPI003699FB0F